MMLSFFFRERTSIVLTSRPQRARPGETDPLSRSVDACPTYPNAQVSEHQSPQPHVGIPFNFIVRPRRVKRLRDFSRNSHSGEICTKSGFWSTDGLWDLCSLSALGAQTKPRNSL